MTNRKHASLDPTFVDKLSAICKANLSPEARAEIDELNNQRPDIKAGVMLVRAIHILESRGEHLSKEVKNQILQEHIEHLVAATRATLIAEIVDSIERQLAKGPASPDFALFIIKLLAISEVISESANIARHNAATTVLQNLVDLFPEALEELNKEN